MRKSNRGRGWPETLEIRVHEAVCLNLAIIPDFPRIPLMELVPAPDRWMVARVLEPIAARIFAPRPPTAVGSLVMNPKPMSL